MLDAGRETLPAESSSAGGVIPAWLQLGGVAVLALVVLIFCGVLSVIGKPIPDALSVPASALVGAVLTMVRGRS